MQRTEKCKEYDLFVLKIQKLEKLCQALQDERKVLYAKIREVRQANSSLPSKILGSSKPGDDSEAAALLTPGEIQEIQEEDLVLSEDMARLKEQQAKLQLFADSLLAPIADNEEEDNKEKDLEEDLVASAFIQFKTKSQVKEELVPVPEEQVVAETGLPEPEKTKEIQKPGVSTPENIPTDPNTEAVKVQPLVEVQEVQPVKPDEIQQQQLAEQVPPHEAEKLKTDPPTDLKPEPDNVQTQVKPDEEIQPPEQHPASETETVTPLEPEAKIQEKTGDEKVQQDPSEPLQLATGAASAFENTAESSTKQAPKKKKKKGGKSAS